MTGGFESVADWIETTLRRDGHDIERITIGVNDLAHRPFGLPVPDHVWHRAPEYFPATWRASRRSSGSTPAATARW